jgi:NAD(P)-dependent dehydrogenase (short-subunit alcohol dehydrogenase family)
MSALDLTGKTALVTGATDGLGRGVAHELAAAGAMVLIHGRDPERIRATMDEIRSATGSDLLRAYRADFAELAQVHALGAQVLDHEERLDILVNNAGIGTEVPGGPKRQLSADGYELRFAVNYLAGYALTRQLLPLLERSAPARIVMVSSAGQTPLQFDDLMLEHGYSGSRAYCQSKLAQILFTRTLADELIASAISVSVTALHPATFMPTKIVPSPTSTLAEGVDATVRLAAAPDVDGISGTYFNGLREAPPDPQAESLAACAELERASRALVVRALAARA